MSTATSDALVTVGSVHTDADRGAPKIVGGKERSLEFHVKKTADFQDPGPPGPCIYVSDGVFEARSR